MIVKNEAHVICEAFDNLLQLIPFDYWVISDTGSTDNTQNIICEYFAKKNIPGELVHHEWQDFGYNRTKALEAAYNKSDYLFIFDADDRIVGDFNLPATLDKDMYQLKFGKEFTYLRPLLVNNRRKWRYVGVLHEYLDALEQNMSIDVLNGDYYVDSRRLGDRNKNPNKYRDDAIILKKGFEKELNAGNHSLAGRYSFYCAQSYKDANMHDDSIEWYKKCLDMNNWGQEKYYSSLMIGTMYIQKGDIDNALKYFCKTVEYDHERMEGVVSAMEILQKKNEHLLVNALYHRFKNYNQVPSDYKLFVSQNAYKDKLEYLNSISASYVNDKESGYACCKKILLALQLAVSELSQTIRNLNVYKEFLDNDTNLDILTIFTNVDKLIFVNKLDDANVSTCWKNLYEKRRLLLKDNKSVKQNKFIKVVNLQRRPDRRLDMEKKLKDANVKNADYEIIDAIDGKHLKPSFVIKHLFRGNDFSYKKGVIGCALSHLSIWEKLLSDTENDYYIVLEDDITINKDFSKYIDAMKNTFFEKDVVFIGYHMKTDMREKFKFLYNRDDGAELNVAKLTIKLFYGGTIGYSINKLGAKKLLENSRNNGIQRAIDYFMIDSQNVEYWESRPQLVFSECVQNENDGQVDSDVQRESEVLEFTANDVSNQYVFLQGIDQINYDITRVEAPDVNILLEIASNTPGCVGVNTFGYLKNNIVHIEKVGWFGEKDGIFIKKEVYDAFIEKQQREEFQKKQKEEGFHNITIDISDK
jgi:GR25 family glycosyltransferase involved in LPS biosynthesis